MKSILIYVFISICLTATVFAQDETLTNNEIILMTKAGLSHDLIVWKIKDSGGRYDTTTQALIELKKAGVADDVIALMMRDKADDSSKTSFSAVTQNNLLTHIVLDSKEALRAAKTIAISKTSLNPSPQALEKELLKRKEWQRLNLNIVRYKEGADLSIEISFVPLSLITHRYSYHVYDIKSGTIIAAGETTSWGSLAENLAREISKKLVKIL